MFLDDLILLEDETLLADFLRARCGITADVKPSMLDETKPSRCIFASVCAARNRDKATECLCDAEWSHGDRPDEGWDFVPLGNSGKAICASEVVNRDCLAEIDLVLLLATMSLRCRVCEAVEHMTSALWCSGEVLQKGLALAWRDGRVGSMNDQASEILEALGVDLMDDRIVEVQHPKLNVMLRADDQTTDTLWTLDRRPIIATVASLPKNDRGMPDRLIVFHNPSLRNVPEKHVLKAVFELTNAEAGLAHALGEGKSVAEYVEERGLKKSYGDTLAKRVLAKSGARDRAQLTHAIISLTKIAN